MSPDVDSGTPSEGSSEHAYRACLRILAFELVFEKRGSANVEFGNSSLEKGVV